MKTMQTWSGRLARAAGVMIAGFALVQGSQALAQATPKPPERMTYQGYLAGSDGVPLGNSNPKNYDVIFRIFDSESGATPLWGEQQTVTVDKGNFSVLLGEGAAVAGVPFAGITLSSLFTGPTASDRFIGLTVKGLGSGGADVEILPRVRLLSTPYAFLSAGAVKLVQNTGADLITSSGNQVTVSGDLTANVLKAGEVTATNSFVTGTLYPQNVRANTLVVTNITSLSTVQAGNVTAFGTLATPEVRAGSVTVSNSFSAASLAASSTLTLGGKGVVVGENSGLRILYGNTDTQTLGVALNGVTLRKVIPGVYTIVFSTPFTSAPAVVVTPHGYGGYNLTVRRIGAANPYNSPTQLGASTTGFEVVSVNDGGTTILDAGFDWIVIGK